MKCSKKFLWGVSASSYQVEGAAFAEGRGKSIWDTFSAIPCNTYAGENGNVAIDQFHRYKEDVRLMVDLGVQSYRFSIAWPRVFPNAGKQGNGNLNPKGFNYYNKLVDELLKKGIKPAVTLYHWDLPQGLQDNGGWVNRDTAFCFQEYAETVYKALGDRVNMWMPHNEPWCTAILGHLHGIHAPGIRNKQKTYDAIHHLNLSHGLAVQAFRSSKAKKGNIGPALNLYAPSPYSNSKEDILATDRAKDGDSRMFLNPLFGKPYPKRHLIAQQIKLPIKQHDMKIIAQKIDFVGVNYYTEQYAKFDKKKPEQFVLVEQPTPKTDMGWSITPQGIYNVLKFVQDEIGNVDMYITENGCASLDTVEQNQIHDYQRIHYHQEHIAMCQKAIKDGIPLKGYFLWSLIDNYEWSFGYNKRFGLVYCDYNNLTRIPKDSYYHYKKIIEESNN